MWQVHEILWFIILPVWRELKIWWEARQTYITLRSVISISVFGALLLLLCVPWSSKVSVPAIMKAQNEFRIFPMLDGKVIYLDLVEGQSVEQGQVLLELDAPQLRFEIEISKRRKILLETRIARACSNALDLSSITVLRQELQSEAQNLEGLIAKSKELFVRAPFSGHISNVDAELHEGQWVSHGNPVALLQDGTHVQITGMVSSDGLERISKGDSGKFIAEGSLQSAVPLTITAISNIAEARLSQEIMSEMEGGKIPVKPGKNETIIPTGTWFQVVMAPDRKDQSVKLTNVMRGVAIINGVPESYIRRIFRRVASVLIRESGF